MRAPVLTTIPCFYGTKLISVPEQQNPNALNFNFLSGSCAADTASLRCQIDQDDQGQCKQGCTVILARM